MSPHRFLAPRTKPTPRQREVWTGICAGLSNQQIADQLGINKRTVDKHRCELYARMGAKTIAAIVLLGVKHGIVEVPE